MTATAVQVSQRAEVSEKEWVRLFPMQAAENYTSSMAFMKQLTIVAVSTITYLKNAVPENCYKSETFGGLKLKILKDKCDDDMAQFISTSMYKAFDAFDKKYIHQLALCFYRGACAAENLIEYHVFEYSYSPEGVALNINSKGRNTAKQAMRCSTAAVKARTAMLIRSLTLFVWQNCTQELPDNYNIGLWLYYNDDAPKDYQAPGFRAAPELNHPPTMAGEALCLGFVQTPYHKIIARALARDLVEDSDAAVASDSRSELPQDDVAFTGGEPFVSSAAVSSETAPALRCPCVRNDFDHALITCQYCGTQQHAVCFGFLAPASEHCCADCADADSTRTPSCELLAGLGSRKRESLCLFRRTLMLCSSRSSISGKELMTEFELSDTATAKMIRILQSHNILPDTDSQEITAIRKINPVRVKLTFKHFFRVEELEDTTVDTVVAETTDAVDPVADMLRPLERVTLNNSCQLGSTAENTDGNIPVPGDTSLDQYREKDLTNNMCEELRVGSFPNPIEEVKRIGNKRKMDDGDDKPSKLARLRSGAKIRKSSISIQK